MRSVHSWNGAIIGDDDDDDDDGDDDDKNTVGISLCLSFKLRFCGELAEKFLSWDMENQEIGDYHSHWRDWKFTVPNCPS